MKEFYIRLLLGIIGEFFIAPFTAAKYAKHLIRIRDYLLILFPVAVYPPMDMGASNLGAMKMQNVIVPPAEVERQAPEVRINYDMEDLSPGETELKEVTPGDETKEQ